MMAKLFALFNHPVTQAIIDIGQYAARRHIIPAVNRNAAPPTQEEVNETANEYAMGADSFAENNSAESNYAETNYSEAESETQPKTVEEILNETSSGQAKKRTRRL